MQILPSPPPCPPSPPPFSPPRRYPKPTPQAGLSERSPLPVHTSQRSVRASSLGVGEKISAPMFVRILVVEWKMSSLQADTSQGSEIYDRVDAGYGM